MTPADRTNPLDLNNLPDDYSRDGKHSFEQGSSSSGYRKKKSGGKDGKDESGKVYECRFCSLKFCKSQALGGHMNRHRQERETETLNRARQLVFNNENLAAHGAPHLGGQAMAQGNFHQTAGNMGDPTLPFRSVYGPRMFPGSSTTLLQQQQPPPPPPPQPYLYQSPSRLISYPSQCPPPHSMMNDYYVGHVLNNSSQYGHQAQPNLNYRGAPESNYTCIGAPVGGHGFSQRGGRGLDMGGTGAGGGGGGGRDGSLSNQEEGLNWGTGYAGTTQQRLDPSLINRFQDGF